MSYFASSIFTADQVSRLHDRSLFTGWKDHPMLPNDGCPADPRGSADTKSVAGQQRKSRTTILMSVNPPKAEVSLSRFDVRFAPKGDIHSSPRSLKSWTPERKSRSSWESNTECRLAAVTVRCRSETSRTTPPPVHRGPHRSTPAGGPKRLPCCRCGRCAPDAPVQR